MSEQLTIELPSQGWKQLLTARMDMLNSFDQAREKAKAHEVEAFHGEVAEAEFRKYLRSFLPNRYGVTSGYIVSSGLKSTEKTPHFDVIIYDQLESPILWVEDCPDVSSQGRSLAIPVEYVRCVLEIKSTFSPKTAGDSIDHLRDLLPLMGGPDEPSQRYKLHLPPTFCCGVVFFDLKHDCQFSEAALKKIRSGLELRGFVGGMILRGEGHSKPLTGRIFLLRSETPIESTIGKSKQSLLQQMGMSQSVQLAQNLHCGTMLTWMEPAFCQFGFDLIAMMQGKYEAGRLSSFYGMGTSDWEKRKT